MITFEQATALRPSHGMHMEGAYRFPLHSRFEMLNHFNADGSRKRWRRNGATKTWKTRPGHFRIPIKHGLYDYGYITHENAHEFVVAD